ncbi:MAG: preprotein translocase subunit SecA [bacterium]
MSKRQQLTKYKNILHKINKIDLSELSDSELLSGFNTIKVHVKSNCINGDTIAETFAYIREVFDRRLGIWRFFNNDLSLSINDEYIISVYNYVKQERMNKQDSNILLDAEFYKKIRSIRQKDDNLTFFPYDVQILGALALCDGKIVEMGTGEGKTVVAVFLACLWAISGKKVHIATVNDYLALRDCEWMMPVYSFLGLNVDCILSYKTDLEKRRAYSADIVYGSNYEFGFDYLRDNLKKKLSERIQGDLEYVIIDEIDSILIDEATTPLIISGSPYNPPISYWKLKPVVELLLNKQKTLIDQLFEKVKSCTDQQLKLIRLLQIKMADPWNKHLLSYLNGDILNKISKLQGKFAAARSEYKIEEELFYIVDEKNMTVKLTDRGFSLVENELGEEFFTLNNDTKKSEYIRNFFQLLRAYILLKKDEDYIVHNGRIIIVDEFTGRMAFGKKYEEGLHQAIECKENLQITAENYVIGKITHPNYFRLYKKIAGMTATAHTSAEEFKKLYKLSVVRIPPNKPIIRNDLPDCFFKTEDEKINAIIKDIERCFKIGRPVLVGTRSIEKSEHLSKILTDIGIPHNVLNAKNHAQEAEIIKSAGKPYAVTIATNMAGRGTDIILDKDLSKIITENYKKFFGDTHVNELGLHVIGTERHTARRIDDQLKGRSGRQGDPGSSRFYLSLQDDLFRVLDSEELSNMVKAINSNDYKQLTRMTLKAQRKSEEISYYIRKQLIEHDDIIDKQRKIIYKMRLDLLSEELTKNYTQLLINEYVNDLVNDKKLKKSENEWDIEKLKDIFYDNFMVRVDGLDGSYSDDDIKNKLKESLEQVRVNRENIFGNELSRKLERVIILDVIDSAYADYLSYQSEFDKSILLRSYVKDDILTDYRLEVSKSFNDLISSIRISSLKEIFSYPLPGIKVKLSRRKKEILSSQIKNLLNILD